MKDKNKEFYARYGGVDHIDRAIKDGNLHEVSLNPNLTKEHIDKLIDHPERGVRYYIAKHPNLSKENIDKLVNDDNENVRNSITYNPLYKELYER